MVSTNSHPAPPFFTVHSSPPVCAVSCSLFSPLFWYFVSLNRAWQRAPHPRPRANTDDLLNYFTGSYRLIGKELDSDKTFLGRVIIDPKGHELKVLRTVNGMTSEGVGRIEFTPVASSRVLRIRFSSGNSKFEGTYLYHSDLDNYTRITGYLYKVDPRTGVPIDTKNPGLEALFPEAPLKPSE
jgi:hypothetical protein